MAGSACRWFTGPKMAAHDVGTDWAQCSASSLIKSQDQRVSIKPNWRWQNTFFKATVASTGFLATDSANIFYAYPAYIPLKASKCSVGDVQLLSL